MHGCSFKLKTWINLVLQRPLFVKNKLLIKFIDKRDLLKKELHMKYRNYRNLISVLMKQIGIILKTHGKKSKLYLKTATGSVPTVFSLDHNNDNNITNL